jgi:hypothetical protein
MAQSRVDIQAKDAHNCILGPTVKVLASVRWAIGIDTVLEKLNGRGQLDWQVDRHVKTPFNDARRR